MIKATIIKDSTNKGKRITTFELEYPRFIHSEMLTHRLFSRNAASSRAIPIATMNDNIRANPAMPFKWGINKAGMQASEQLPEDQVADAKYLWNWAKNDAIAHSENLVRLGLHKQITNRITEPFQHMKTIVTATEFGNWFELRNHPDAQPEIHELARLMLEAMHSSQPQELCLKDWHLPYIDTEYLEGKLTYSLEDKLLTVDEARRISVSCCAQVSYRKNDTSLEKANSIFLKLRDMVPFHASPFEHQATPMHFHSDIYGDKWEKGITHMNRQGYFGSGNFYGWIQYRQLI